MKEKKRGTKRSFIPRSMQVKGLVSADNRKPTPAVAHALPLTYQEMDNSTLVTLATLGEHDACKEVLLRHIMDVDACDYDVARTRFKEISKENAAGAWILSLPYKIGIAAALVAGFGSFPMVFDLGTALAFNADFVTTDVPEPQDLETFLEVGSWTWNVRVRWCSRFRLRSCCPLCCVSL